MQVGSEEQEKAVEAPSPSMAYDHPFTAAAEHHQGSRRRLLESYEPLPYSLIEAEISLFQEVQESMNQLWEEESEKYEQTMEVRVDGKTMTVPRRNYLNEKGVVEDETLFPYHSACYPLLDAYDCLYDDVDLHPISINAIRPFPFVSPDQRQDFPGHDEVQGCMPTSFEAITGTLVHGEEQADGDVWLCLSHAIAQHKSVCMSDDLNGGPSSTLVALPLADDAEAWAAFAADHLNLFTSVPFGAWHLPRGRDERTTILLKLVRHSLSELQRDYKLAAAAMVLMMRFHDLDDVRVFRRLLVVIDSEFVACHRPCDHFTERRDHHCHDWMELYALLNHVFAGGVAWFSQDHAICLAGFVRSTYLREFGSFANDPTEESVTGKRKRLLKRAVVALWADQDEDLEGRTDDLAGRIPVEFIEVLVGCVGERGTIDRNRLLNLRGKHSGVGRDLICKCLDSYQNCVRVLVSIAESTVQLLPESERFYNIASTLVQSLCRCLASSELEVNRTGYFGVENRALQDTRLISPLRYANCVTSSTSVKRDRLARDKDAQSKVKTDPTALLLQRFELLFEKEPPNDALTAVRGLFLRNLVDVRYSGLGYGDFLVWCRYEISPLDPLLFWNECAYPVEEEDVNPDDEDEIEEEDRPVDWEVDEDEHTLSIGEIDARHDFTLLLLLRAWQAPWTPETDASFQPGFRDAAKAVALCTHKLGFPHDTMVAICSFLNRDWWEDSRKQCWSYECRCDQTCKAIAEKFSDRNSIDATAAPLEYCPHCRVAMYCSKECRDKDYKIGHKKRCCRPPMRSTVPDKEELQLCIDILKDNATPLPKFLSSRNAAAVELVRKALADPGSKDEKHAGGDAIDDDMDGDSDADDEGSWETVDSGDEAIEEAITKTARIYKYFKETAYSSRT